MGRNTLIPKESSTRLSGDHCVLAGDTPDYVGELSRRIVKHCEVEADRMVEVKDKKEMFARGGRREIREGSRRKVRKVHG